MRHLLLLLIATALAVNVSGQITINDSIKVDTLSIWLNVDKTVEDSMKVLIEERFSKVINDFNTPEKNFLLKIDSLKEGNWIHMEMNEIKYVDWKKNLLWSGVGLAIIGGHVYMISSFSWTLPIIPLLPATVSRVDLSSNPELITRPKRPRIFVNPNGFWVKKQKQEKNFIKKWEKSFMKFLVSIDKQEGKKNIP